jgi:electron transfer flavoprotein-quinone oxidoreductase
MYGDYGRLLSDVLYGVYNLDTRPRKHLLATVMSARKKSSLGIVRLAKDALAAVRAM